MILSGWNYFGLAAYCWVTYSQAIKSSEVCVMVVVVSNRVSGAV